MSHDDTTWYALQELKEHPAAVKRHLAVGLKPHRPEMGGVRRIKNTRS